MGDIVNIHTSEGDIINQNTDIVEMTDSLLLDARNSAIPTEKTISVPIAQLSTLGAGV